MSTEPDPSAAAPAGRRLGWLGVIAGFLLGTMSVGITVNILSDNPTRAGRTLAATSGLGAVAAIAGWLRRYPGSTLQHTARLALWILAATCVLLSVPLPGWTIWLTATAAACLAITILLATTLPAAGWLLGGAAIVGLGVAVAVFGLAGLGGSDVLGGALLVVVDVAIAVLGRVS